MTRFSLPNGSASRYAEGQAIAEAIPHIAWTADTRGSAEYLNRQGCEYAGFPPDVNHGWDWLSLVHPDDSERAYRAWAEAVRTEAVLEVECRFWRADGAFRWHSVGSLPLRDRDGQVSRWIGTATDIDDQKRMGDRLRRAERDSATLEALHSAAPVGLGFIDRELRWVRVNGALAAINSAAADDHLGRTVAELMPALWPQLAPLCEHVLRTGEPVAGRRISGQSNVAGGGTRSWLTSCSPCMIEEELAGVGIVMVDVTDQHDTTEEQAQGEQAQRQLAALTWLGRTRDALDEGRMVLYSQPITPLAGGEPSQELLLRMIGRGGEVIRPAIFLPVAERYGLIGEIDQRVVTQAARLAAGGRRVQANLSAVSISSPDLLPAVEHALAVADASPADLVFEITETALMEDVDAGEAFARGVVDLGCNLALDDFGTGYGSFTRLKQLPIKYLKIDIEFVHDLVSSPSDRHVVEAIVGLAKGFGQETIAEGVEDAETLSLLGESGVDFAQGHHMGRPGPLTGVAV